MLVARTENLLCPLSLTDLVYSGVSVSPSPSPPPAPDAPAAPPSSDGDKLPGYGVAVIVVGFLLFAAVLMCAIAMYVKEKQGKPIFVNLDAVQVTASGGKAIQPTSSTAN